MFDLSKYEERRLEKGTKGVHYVKGISFYTLQTIHRKRREKIHLTSLNYM
jgi:hypothetical protein